MPEITDFIAMLFNRCKQWGIKPHEIEAGNRTPSLITIFKLASALGITPEKIITPIWKVWQKKHR